MQKTADERANAVDNKLADIAATLHQIVDLKVQPIDKKAADADGATVQLHQRATAVSILPSCLHALTQWNGQYGSSSEHRWERRPMSARLWWTTSWPRSERRLVNCFH